MATSPGVTGLRPVTPLEPALPVNPAGDAREDVLSRLSQIATGREYMASVLSRLSDGQFLVKVADAAVRMTLPAGVKPGDDIKLIMVANQPRPTFLLASAESTTGAARTDLSSTGRLIDNLLQSAQRQGLPERVLGQTPLLPAPAAGSAASATQIAHALKDSLGASGLFYESHVGQWASGTRSLESLMREPQASFLRGPGTPDAAALAQAQARLAQGAAAAAALAGAPQADNDDATGARAAQASQPGQAPANGTSYTYGPSGLPLPGTPPPTNLAATPAAPTLSTALLASAPQADMLLQTPDTADPDAARIVSLQLGVLEHHRAAWQGEIWNGQRLQWDVSEDIDEDAHRDRSASEQQSWKSHVRFELPSLGAVSATLHLHGSQVRIQLRAADSGTVDLLQQRSPALASALDLAGSRLDQFTVRLDEDA